MVSSLSLSGKNVIVTGASRGIGLAIAKSFAVHGAKRILLVGRSADRLAEARKTVQERSSSEVDMRVGDVKDRSFWESIARDMKDVDILVNAAGIAHSSLLVTTKPDLIEDVVQTNLLGTIWGCQLIAKAMLGRRRHVHDTGCIINVASLLGVKGGKGSTAYAASKAGVLGLTRSLASEMGSSNVRVNAIVPGYIETEMTKAMTPDARAIALDAIPQKRYGTPCEIAHAAVFLATNAYAANCVLNIDGGLSST